MRVAVIAFTLLVALGIVTFFIFPKEAPPVKTVEISKEVEPRYKIIGTSIEGRQIESYTYGNGKYHILFIGGVHGGYEWNSVFLSYKFLDYLDANKDAVPDNLTVSVIPSANPDGLYRVIGKEGRFLTSDVSTNKETLASGRFNANEVDLNRNFDCNWKPTSLWRERVVNAGSKPFSEPETLAIKNFVEEFNPVAVISWHSQSGAVYASKCQTGILPETLDIMNAYARGSGYPAVKSFDAYVTTGDSDGWLASINIPAITVELTTHETIEWEKNLKGIKALFDYYLTK